MQLPMDNLVFRFLLEYWPVLIAVGVTLLLVYQFLRPKLTAEDLHKGIIQQGVLKVLQEREGPPTSVAKGAPDEWQESLRRVEELRPLLNDKKNRPKAKPQYHHYVTVSLVWILLWAGITIFIIIRIILAPYYYGGEAIFLGYFAYYIVIGLISYLRR